MFIYLIDFSFLYVVSRVARRRYVEDECGMIFEEFCECDFKCV